MSSYTRHYKLEQLSAFKLLIKSVLQCVPKPYFNDVHSCTTEPLEKPLNEPSKGTRQ